MDDLSKRLQDAQEVFKKALEKAVEAVVIAKRELTRTLTDEEKMELEEFKRGRLDL